MDSWSYQDEVIMIKLINCMIVNLVTIEWQKLKKVKDKDKYNSLIKIFLI